MGATMSVYLCPTCQTGLVRVTATSFKATTVEVAGCCLTSPDTVRSVVLPASTPAQWIAATAELAANGFCPDCADTAPGCQYMRAAIPGLDRYLEQERLHCDR